jgi:hypothetical protein
MAQAKHDSITRRALLSGSAAAVPATLIPAVILGSPALASPDFASAPSGQPAPADPIFAAIEAHARACADLDARVGVLAAAEQAAWHAPRGARRAANKRLKAEYAAQGRLCDLLGQQTERFVATVPHTLQGAVAALAYVRAHYAEGYPMCEEEECMTLLASTEQAICRAAGLPVPCVAAEDAEAA